MTLLLAVTGMAPEPWIAALKAVSPERTVVTPATMTDPAAVRYALTWRAERGLLARLPNLEAVFSLGAGVDHLLADPTLPDVPVARIVDPDLTGRMTEWVVLQVLLHHRRQREYDRAQVAQQWRPLPQWSARDLRVGIMGLGELGRDAAEVLARIGFRVSGWSRSPKDVPGIPTYAGKEGLADFLKASDVLVVLLPLTPETRGILSADLFAQLPRDGVLGGPVLINAGRGGLQVERDVIAALRDGTLKAASLDVFAEEPLPATSPLWRLATVTPHVAADSDPKVLARAILDQIAAHERGEPLKNLVDRTSGY